MDSIFKHLTQRIEITKDLIDKTLIVIEKDSNASTEDIKDWAARLSRNTIAAGESEYE